MDEIKILVLQVCTALLAAELLSALFPENTGVLVRGLTILSILSVLLSGILKQDWRDILPVTETSSVTVADPQAYYIRSGTDLLRERLYELLDAAGIEIPDQADSIEIRYRQAEDGTVEIEGVYAEVRFAADRDRANALLRSVLTEAVPLTVYTE